MSSNSLKFFDKNTRKILFIWYFAVTVSSNIDNHPIRAGEGGERTDWGKGLTGGKGSLSDEGRGAVEKVGTDRKRDWRWGR